MKARYKRYWKMAEHSLEVQLLPLPKDARLGLLKVLEKSFKAGFTAGEICEKGKSE